jgi:hypothetical protein
VDRKDLDEIIFAPNENSAAISRRLVENGLLLNPCKFIGTKEISWCDAVTDQGVVTDGRLCIDRQIYATLHRLRLLKFLILMWVRLKLCKALLFPYFFYCDAVFSHLSTVDRRRSQVVFNSCTRNVFNLCRFDHLSTPKSELLGVPLFDYDDFVFFRSFSN